MPKKNTTTKSAKPTKGKPAAKKPAVPTPAPNASVPPTPVAVPDADATPAPATPTKPAKAAKAKVTKPTKEAKAKRVSALDAAVQVLKQAGKPMTTPELVAAMKEQKLWVSPNGKTPHATLHAAISTEIKKKGNESRFRKAERGHFTLA